MKTIPLWGEVAAVLLISGLFLFSASNDLLNHRLTHEYPYGGLTQDYFDQVHRTNDVLRTGQWKFLPDYLSGNNVSNAVVVDVPTLFHLGALGSLISGAATYDVLYLFVLLILLSTGLATYVFIRRHHKLIAMLALPSLLLFFTSHLSLPLSWGKWTYICGAAGLMLTIMLSHEIDRPKRWIYVGLLLIITYTTHVVEAFFAIAIMGVVFLAKEYVSWKDLKTSFTHLKPYVKAGVLFIIGGAYYIIEMTVLRFAGNNKLIGKTNLDPGFPILKLTTIPWPFLVLAGIGVIIGVYLIVTKKKGSPIIVSFIALAFIISFMNSIYGLGGVYPYYSRLSWPIYLSLFISLSMYSMLAPFKKKEFAVLIAFVALTILGAAYTASASSWGQGLMDKDKWDGMRFMTTHTPANSTLFYFFMDGYSQYTHLRLSEREYYVIKDLEGFFTRAQKGIIWRNTTIFRPDSDYTIRTGIFSKTVVPPQQSINDLCGFDYYFLDVRQSQQLPGIEVFNSLVGQKLIDNGMQVVYNTNGIVILKNLDKGKDCITAEVKL